VSLTEEARCCITSHLDVNVIDTLYTHQPPGQMYDPGLNVERDAAAVLATITRARAELRGRGMRWTPQRRALVDVLVGSDGHVTGVELVERCRALDPETTASTVYRTLDVLEMIGLVRHSHGLDGREEFHVLPETEHGHLSCEACGGTWEIEADEARRLTKTLVRDRRFQVKLSHLTIVGRCAECSRGG
jgi:Fur family ferric uptake transcriptional regulator